MKAVIDALNVTYNEKEKRGFIKLNLISLALTGGAILSLLVALGSIVVLPLILSSFGLGGWTETLLRISPLAGADLPRRLRSGRFVSIRSE